jgi:hypothetical protein
VHVAIDEARHQHPTLQIVNLCCGSLVRLYSRVRTNVNESTATHRNGLQHRVMSIDRVDLAVAIDGIGRCRDLGTRGADPQQRARNEGKKYRSWSEVQALALGGAIRSLTLGVFT